MPRIPLILIATLLLTTTMAIPHAHAQPPALNVGDIPFDPALDDTSHARACRLLNAVDSFYQGSPKCQYYLDSAITICPSYAPAWREKAVPYLKCGDFATWRRLMDTAAKLDPMFLAYRGWCRFEFLRDYSGALHYFAVALRPGSSIAGLYGYLHLCVTKLLARDYPGAIAARPQTRRHCPNPRNHPRPPIPPPRKCPPHRLHRHLPPPRSLLRNARHHLPLRHRNLTQRLAALITAVNPQAQLLN